MPNYYNSNIQMIDAEISGLCVPMGLNDKTPRSVRRKQGFADKFSEVLTFKPILKLYDNECRFIYVTTPIRMVQKSTTNVLTRLPGNIFPFRSFQDAKYSQIRRQRGLFHVLRDREDRRAFFSVL